MSKKPQILIVDDDSNALQTLDALLSKEGYDLHLAKDGQEAIDMTKTLLPDLILLDVMLPGMDGFEVCKKIRKSNSVLGEVPIIMITALDDEDSMLNGINSGADDFITKPFNRVKLRARVKAITRLNRYRMLLSERAKFEKVIELSPDGILIVDKKGKILSANSATNQLLRTKKRETVVGKNISDLVSPEMLDEFMEIIKLVISDSSAVKYKKITMNRFDGETVPIEFKAGASEWNDKPAVQFIMRDITDRIEAEAAIKESEAKWRAITENSPDRIMTIDEEGKVLFVNRPLPFDVSKEDLIGSSIYKHVPVQFRPVMKKCFDRTLKTNKPEKYDVEFPGQDGTMRIFESIASPVRLANGSTTITISYRDVTDRKRAEDALRATQEEIKSQTHHLEEVNSAMKILLKQREKDKNEVETNIISNVKKLIIPYIEKLKRSALPHSQAALVNILEANLNNIISPFAGKMSNQFLSLTPMEIQIANLIKEGRSNRDMAELLGLSQNTILFHRFNIRTKLGIKNRRVNLRTYLITYE